MDTGNLGILAGIIITTGFFAMIFGIVYLNNRKKMGMIERGMDPRSHRPHPAPYLNLTWGMLLIGVGFGTFIAYILDHKVFADEDNSFFLYVSLQAFFGGLGLFSSYRIEKKEVLDKNPQYFE